jgi:shikimate dehydrogenase
MKKACIIGYPVSHSRSPMIHNHWAKLHGLDALYEKCEVKPGQAADFIRNLEQNGYQGCNVTIPHKEEVMSALDHISDEALAIGAVNTIWREGGKTLGTNTDGMGFIKNIDQCHENWENNVETALVLGAGGGAKGIIYSLLQKGVQHILLTNRSEDRADDLASFFGKRVKVIDWNKRDEGFAKAEMLINTTSLGMQHQPELEIAFPKDNKQRLVTDIVYVPLKTKLLHDAEMHGHKIVKGLGMLLHQAVPGFEKWFGVKPTVTRELEMLIEADIK